MRVFSRLLFVVLLSMVFALPVFAAAPNAPVLVHPKNNGVVDTANPILYAYYLDPDAADTGTVEFRVSSGSLADCTAGNAIVDTGSSAESGTTNEVVNYTVVAALSDATTYSWCARGDDGVGQSAWTEMGQFTVYLTDTLIGSTYLGGNLNSDDYAEMIGIDPDGNVVIFGQTEASLFPTTSGVFQETNPLVGWTHSTISVFNPDLTTLLKSTYVGATDEDMLLTSGVVDALGNVYISGNSYATTIPQPTVPNGIKTTNDDSNGDVFLIKLNADLDTILYTTFIGSDNDYEYQERSGLAVHPTNEQVAVAGIAWSTDLTMTANAFDSSNTDFDDGFVSIIDTSVSGASGLLYQSYMGGNGYEEPATPNFHTNGHVYFSLYTCASDFPLLTAGSFKPAVDGGSCDAAIVELDPAGTSVTSLVYGTAIGGSNHEEIYNVVIDQNDDLYVCGYTNSSDLTMHANAYDNTLEGTTFDAFFYKLSPDGAGAADLLGSTYLSGTNNRAEDCEDLDIDPQGDVFFAANLADGAPTTPNAFDSTVNSTTLDVYVGKFSSDFSTLIYGSYYDCNCFSDLKDVAIAPTGLSYVTGNTTSPAFPVTSGAYNETHDGSDDFFVGAFALPFDPVIPGPLSQAPDAPVISAVPGDGELQIDFNAPSDNGAALTQYVLRYGETVGFPGNAATVNIPAGASPVSYALAGLTNDTQYSVQVAAQNANGQSAWSNQVDATPTAAGGGRRRTAPVNEAPQVFLGSLEKAIQKVQELTPSATHGSAEQQQVIEVVKNSLFTDLSEDKSFAERLGTRHDQLIPSIDTLSRLQALYAWMDPEGYELIMPVQHFQRQLQSQFASAAFIAKLTFDLFGVPPQYDMAQQLLTHDAPLQHIVDLEKVLMLTMGQMCYTPEVIVYATEQDQQGSILWYQRYHEYLKPFADELLQSEDYVPWTEVQPALKEVFSVLYLYLYGFCLPEYL